MRMIGMKFMAKITLLHQGVNKHGHWFQTFYCKMVLDLVASNKVSFFANYAFYCFIVHEESLSIDVPSSPYWCNSKQLGPGHMLLPHWKLLSKLEKNDIEFILEKIVGDCDLLVSGVLTLSGAILHDVITWKHCLHHRPFVRESPVISWTVMWHHCVNILTKYSG